MRVTVATDGSPPAGAAIDLVAGVAWPSGTELRVVESIGPPPILLDGAWPVVAVDQAETIESELVRMAEDVLSQARTRLTRPGLNVSGEVLRGRPATAIVDAAADMRADLIVLGSRGHGTIQSMVLGSVSAEVVDHAGVPVLVARGPNLRRVLLAWDGSPSAQLAADLLRSWPIFAGSTVQVVTVASINVPWWTGFPVPGSSATASIYVEGAAQSERDRAEAASALLGDLRAAGLDVVDAHRDGDAATEIIAAARTFQADLVVLGTHGRTGLTRLLLGSVARNVLHHAPCSVLVVRKSGWAA
jgi:nucleotide-binding universal stress UspA family protein